MPNVNRKPPAGAPHVQSVLVPKAKFTLAEAKSWTAKHGEHGRKFITRGLDEGGEAAKYYHFRQYDPNDGTFNYYHHRIDNGVVLVNAVPRTVSKAVRKGFWGGVITATEVVDVSEYNDYDTALNVAMDLETDDEPPEPKG